MTDEHFFPGHGEFFPGHAHGDFSSGIGAAAFFGSSYAPPGLDAHAAMQLGFGTVAWAGYDDLQLPADSSAAHFDSALSSLVSSPAHNAGGDDVAAICDLIGPLGSICNAAAAAGSASNACYSTPLSSPPRGASSAFQGCYHGGAAALEAAAGSGGGRLSRVASSKSLSAAATPPPVLGNPVVETSPKIIGTSAETPEPVIMLPAAAAAKANGGTARKRKASGKDARASSSAMAAAAANASPKRSKGAVDGGGGGTSKDDEDTDAAAEEEKPKPEPAKGYIHVRARRGQATDSHSLAERVRRERISERMKMLQSVVPGCNTITGKALMLDEIINYVQSLQRQVEFLSMKLATMNPGAVAVELDTHYQQQLPAATLAYPLFAAAQTEQLDSWEAQHLQSILNHSTAAVHGHHDLYASPSPPAPPQPLHHHHNNSGFHGK